MKLLKDQLQIVGKECSELLEQQTKFENNRLQLFHVTQHYTNPRLINANNVYDAFYEDGIVHVILNNDKTEKFYFDEDQNVIDAFFKKGQREDLVFWFGGRFFNVAKKTNYEEHKLNRKTLEEIAEKIREKRFEIHALQDKIERIEFWEQYNLPFKFIADIKIALSGLSESSSGNGCKSNTVRHVVLQEDYVSGSLKRKTNQYLCSQQKGLYIPLYTDIKIEDIQHVITCKECLVRIEKYKKNNQ
ncbi:hypothetical protein [Sulfurospirillum multivorans]|uniref:Uncharacterized protein n=2 Tax=Sulfurospirillum multivorans TaxID=66821 RepID=A0AA86DZR9_SULMK|nr:hypothetical protein [Sulfurospirillum multivorans]AHJ13120.1 hypothetical protein SMUL_1865 [Sulfurospirillum multivorans DSM 12446]QEH06608.1 hypothetical protein SMN_1843 [Sulfurospirillum multivorans]